METRQWYFAVGNQKQGPIAEEDLCQRLASGQLTPDTLVWTQGMDSWMRAGSVSGLMPASPMNPPSFPPSYNQGFGLTKQYAGFWKRLVALVIDQIVLSVVGVVSGAVMGAFVGGIMGAGGSDVATIQIVAAGLGYILGIVLNWLYFTLLESSEKQATLGKMALGIVVTDLNGQRISFWKANGRYWAKIISAIIFCVGFLMVAFTEKKQGLHDIMSGCLVVNK